MPIIYPPSVQSEFQKFQYTQTLAAVQLGRNNWPELLYQDTSQTFAAPTSPILPDYINLDRTLGDLYVNFKGRITVTVGNYVLASPDAPQSLLQRFRLYGNYQRLNQQTPWDVSGATAFLFGRISQPTNGGGMWVNDSLAADPGSPQVAGISLAVGTYDCDLWWWFPMYPLIGQGRDVKISQLPYYLNGDDWGTSLKVQWFWGDKTALGNSTGATVAFGGYGTGTGNPTLSLLGNYTLNGDFQGQLGSGGLVVRNENFLTSFTAITTNPVQLLLLQKNPTSNIVIRSGVLDTHQTAGVQCYASLSDRIMEQTSIFVGTKPQRNNSINMGYKAMARNKMNTTWPQGTFCIPYDESQSILNANAFNNLDPSTQLWLKAQILTANANQQISVVQEQIFGGPFGG